MLNKKIYNRNNPIVLGQNNSNVPNVIKLFADAFAKAAIEVNSVVGQRMILILKHVQVRFFSFLNKCLFEHIEFRQFHQSFKHV